MANPVVRNRVLELLEEGDATVTELANRLGVRPNTASKALAHARENGGAHIVAYVGRAPVYRNGPGVDAPRPAAPEPVSPAEERCDAVKARDVDLPAYFEIPEMPGQRFFRCEPLRASMSVSSCGSRWEKANSTDADADRFHTCRRCARGAHHAGRVDHNSSPFRGMTICGRCHRGATRLIGRHLCISCYNAQLVACKNRNRKGTAPKKLTAEMLARRTISYLAGGRLKTKTIDLSVAMTELVVAVLRDETHAPQFGWRNTSMDWLRDDVIYDRAIGEIGDEGVPVADAAAVADSEQEQAVAPNVASAQADAVEPVPAPLPDVVESVEADPYDSLRDAVEQLEHDLPVSMPTRPHRSATKMRQQPRRQVRVSAMTANLLRSIGALPPPAPPVVVPVPQPVSSYSATLYAV